MYRFSWFWTMPFVFQCSALERDTSSYTAQSRTSTGPIGFAPPPAARRTRLETLSSRSGAFVRGAGTVYLQNPGHDILCLVYVLHAPDIENRLPELRNALVALV